jgi:hypothetical protein
MAIMLMVVLCSVAAAQTVPRLPVAEPNKPKHNQVVVEFPGHKYSLEIAVKETKEMDGGEERNVQTVFAFMCDTHYEPVIVEAKDIRLNFVVDRKPKSFILPAIKADAKVDPKAGIDLKKQSVFELKDPELIKLISEGWQGNPTATMTIGRTPFTARLMKAKDFKPHVH